MLKEKAARLNLKGLFTLAFVLAFSMISLGAIAHDYDGITKDPEVLKTFIEISKDIKALDNAMKEIDDQSERDCETAKNGVKINWSEMKRVAERDFYHIYEDTPSKAIESAIDREYSNVTEPIKQKAYREKRMLELEKQKLLQDEFAVLDDTVEGTKGKKLYMVLLEKSAGKSLNDAGVTELASDLDKFFENLEKGRLVEEKPEQKIISPVGIPEMQI